MEETMTVQNRIHLRKSLLAGALAAATLVSLPFSSAIAQESNTLVIARDMDLNSLDPNRAFCDTCQIYLSSVYDRLVDLAPDNKTIEPLLAASWDINDDQTQFTFHLDPAAKFADGSPVEAKDVKWSFERLKNLKGNASFMMDGVTSIETPDEKTVVVKLENPNSEFLGILAAPYTSVINSDVASENGASAAEGADSSDTADAWFQSHSAGSGPFVLKSYRPDNELRLARNDNYWRDEKAKVTEVVISETKDAVTQAQRLQGGDVDIAMQIDPDTAKNIPTDEITIKSVPSFNFVYLGVSPGAKNLPVPFTPKVREAISLALDYEGIINLTVGGEGKKQAAPIPNGFPGTEDLPLPERNVDKAKQLLEEAGVKDGFTVDAIFPNTNTYGVDFAILMQKVQQDLAEVGIQINLKPVEFSVWRETINSDGIPITAVYYAPDYYGSGQYVQYFSMTKGSPWAKRAGAERDPSVYNPEEAEELAKALATSGEESAKHFAVIAKDMIADKVIMPLVSPNLILAYRNNISGVRYSACCNLPLVEISRK
jgi:peptide/nickel transport system substrate-binding protein